MSAPEVLTCRKNNKPIIYSFASDIYMFGMAMYEVMQGYQGGNRIWNLRGNQ